MPLVELETVFDRLSGFPVRTFEEGKLVIAEGSSTGRLLFLIQGEVEVSQDGWHIASVAEPGAVSATWQHSVASHTRPTSSLSGGRLGSSDHDYRPPRRA